MPLSFNLLNIIFLLASLQGLLLALMFSTSPKFNRKSNLFLALLLLSISLACLKNGLYDIGVAQVYPVVAVLPLAWIGLIPFTLYYYFQYLVQPNYKFDKKEYLPLLIFAVDMTWQIGILFLFLFAPDFLETHRHHFYTLSSSIESISIVYCLVVIILLLRQLRYLQNELYDYYSEIENKSLLWLRNIFIAILVLWGLWVVPFLYHSFSPNFEHHHFYPLWLGLAIIIYWLAYSTYYRRDLFEIPNEAEKKPAMEKKAPELSSKTEEHYHNLLHLMEEEKLYQNPNLSMSLLAEKMELSNGYLSQIINQKEGKNFFDFVNTYRVEEVKRNLMDEKFAHYSILGIGMESGFKSKSTFNAVFKKMVGQTPSAFRKGKK